MNAIINFDNIIPKKNTKYNFVVISDNNANTTKEEIKDTIIFPTSFLNISSGLPIFNAMTDINDIIIGKYKSKPF